MSLRLGCKEERLHAFGLSCSLVCPTPRSIESPGRHVHSYPLQMGRRPVVTVEIVNCTVSARGDFPSVSPDSTLGSGPGIDLVLLFTIIFLYVLLLFFFLSRVTFSFNLPFLCYSDLRVGLFSNIALLVTFCVLTVRTLWESTACQDFFH